MEVIPQEDEHDIQRRFLLDAIARKLCVRRSYLEIAIERIGTPTKRSSFRSSVGIKSESKKATTRKKKLNRERSPVPNAKSSLKQDKIRSYFKASQSGIDPMKKLESFYFKKPKLSPLLISCSS